MKIEINRYESEREKKRVQRTQSKWINMSMVRVYLVQIYLIATITAVKHLQYLFPPKFGTCQTMIRWKVRER